MKRKRDGGTARHSLAERSEASRVSLPFSKDFEERGLRITGCAALRRINVVYLEGKSGRIMADWFV